MHIKNKITWREIPQDDCIELQYDLSGTDENNKEVDITHTYKNTWSVYYNKVSIKHHFLSRDEAKAWAESVDLIDELSKKF